MSADMRKPERETQDGVIALFRDRLGYQYPGDWRDRPDSPTENDFAIAEALTLRDGVIAGHP